MRPSAIAGDAVCLVDCCETPAALGTASTMCQQHWQLVSSKVRWKIWDQADALLDLRKHSTKAIDYWRERAIDEANEKNRGEESQI